MAKQATAASLIEKGQTAKNEWAASQKAARDEVSNFQMNGIEKITTDPETYLTYLDTQANNPHISASNIAAAISQKPDCTVMATVDKWAKQGRTLNNGEKDNTIKMLKPQDKNPRFYEVIELYDISQTIGKDVQPLKLKDGSREMEKALVALSHYSPTKLEPCEMQGALYDPNAKTIFYSVEMTHAETFVALSTEIAHAKLHNFLGEYYHRDDYSFEAQCTSYVACKRFGIDVSPPNTSSVPKLYEGLEDVARRNSLNAIQDISYNIGRNIEKEINPPQIPRNRGNIGRNNKPKGAR